MKKIFWKLSIEDGCVYKLKSRKIPTLILWLIISPIKISLWLIKSIDHFIMNLVSVSDKSFNVGSRDIDRKTKKWIYKRLLK